MITPNLCPKVRFHINIPYIVNIPYIIKHKGEYTVVNRKICNSMYNRVTVYKNAVIDLEPSMPWSREELTRRKRFVDDITDSEILCSLYCIKFQVVLDDKENI